MRQYKKLHSFMFLLCYSAILILAAPITSAKGQGRSNGVVVESVDDYSIRNGPSLSNSVANGDGLIQTLFYTGDPPIFYLSDRWINRNVWDTDFVDADLDNRGGDRYFDKPGTAISYFTGHGITIHGCYPNISCSTTAACTTPNSAVGERMPGSCRFSPMDAPRCCYMVDRAAATSSPSDQFSGLVNYTSGPIRWGESPTSGSWAQAGTDGGTNMVVLDISHGVYPPFWYETFRSASAGVHMIATLMTAGGDTANVADRGATFASFYKATALQSVARSWLNTMAWLPANEGIACPGGGGGRGFNGCGCHIVVAMDSTPQAAAAKLQENWVELTDDSKDAKGNSWYSAQWLCNYPLRSTGQTAWELP
jgi:hypothetical protein